MTRAAACLLCLLLAACGSSAHDDAAAPPDGDASTDAGADTTGDAADGHPDANVCPIPPADGGEAEIPGPTEAQIAAQAPCTNGWCRLNPFPADEPIERLWGASAREVWLAADEGEILYWDGSRYYEIAAPQARLPANRISARAIWGSGPDDVWIGNSAGAQHFDGFGWSDPTSSEFPPVYAISGRGRDDVWFGTAGGMVLHRTAAGTAVAIVGGFGEQIVGVWAVAADDVWAIGDATTVAHFDGHAWRPVMPDQPIPGAAFYAGLADVWGNGPDDVWMVGYLGTVAHWNGQVLHVEPNFTTAHLLALWGSGADVWAVGGAGSVFRRVDGGWCNVWTGPRLDFTWIWGSAGDDVWVGGGLRVFHWDGSGWTERSRASLTDPIAGITGTADGARWLTSSNALQRWDGSGIHAVTDLHGGSRVQAFSASDIWTIAPSPAAFGAAAPWHWNGQALQAETAPAGARLADVAGTSADNLWACGDGVLLQRTTAGWQAPAGLDLAGTTFTRLWFRTPGDGWAAGTGAAPLARWNGASWTKLPAAVVGATAVVAAWGSADDDVWFSADAGVLHWDGSGFTLVPDDASGPGVSGIVGTGPARAWMFGSGGVLSALDGRHWTTQQSGTAKTLLDGWAAPSGDVYLVGEGGVILHHGP
jgi:hypothetical protein